MKNTQKHCRKPIAVCLALMMLLPSVFAASERASLTYLYAGTTAGYLKNINATKHSLNMVSPDYFDITDDGKLLITPANKIDKAFIGAMHDQDIKVVPFISNHWDRPKGVAALENREQLAAQVAAKVKEYNLDGVNVDIENVTAPQRDANTDFVRLLKQKLPSDKSVSIAVAANPAGWTTGWHGSYDYKELGKAADFLMIMSYDESYSGGPEGPVSSKAFFEKSLKYALNQGVPKEKIIMGMPFYGRAWKDGAPTASGGFGIVMKDVEYLIANYASSVKFDDDAASVRVRLTIKADDVKPKLWGGRVLEAGNYTVWYDSPKCIAQKLEIIASGDILGAGSWALGQEEEVVWTNYAKLLNAGLETPKPTPTAKPTANPTPTMKPTAAPVPNRTQIARFLKKAGDPRTITANTKLTRAEAAVAVCMYCNLKPQKTGKNFTDTKKHWAEGYINALCAKGLVRGNGKQLFPDRPLKRGQLAGLLDRVLVLPNTIDYHKIPFTDIQKGRPSANAIVKLATFDIVKPLTDKKYCPNNKVSLRGFGQVVGRIRAAKVDFNADRLIPPSAQAYDEITLYDQEEHGPYWNDRGRIEPGEEPIIDPR